MSELQLTIKYEEFASVSEMLPEDQELISLALEAQKGSYSPYSHFQVGAALKLVDGTVIKGANQENAAYPSGLCAERTAMFAAGANYPDVPDEDKANPDKLKEFILRKDKQRQSYYNYYSMKKWGRADTYNMSIDTGLLGIDGTVNLLTQVITDFESKA